MIDTDRFFIGFILSIFITGMFIGISIVSDPDSSYNIVKNAKAECEKNLPRNQHCKIIAIPVEQGE